MKAGRGLTQPRCVGARRIVGGLLTVASVALLGGCLYERTQRAWAREVMPAPLSEGQPYYGPLRQLIVRAYADPDHRRLVMGWQLRFFKAVERANPVLRARFGAELVIESVRPWERPDGSGSLNSALFELARLDPGEDVDFVIGLVAPLAMVSDVLDRQGMTHFLSRHVVLRGMDDTAEAQAIAGGFKYLSEDERQALYRARLQHKEVVVLLHELGHNLGALHVDQEGALMRSVIGMPARQFLDGDAEAMDFGLTARGPGRNDSEQAVRVRQALAEFYRRRADVGEGTRRAALIAWLSDPGSELLADHLVDSPPSSEGAAEADPTTPGGLRLPPPRTPASVLAEARALGPDDPEAAWVLAQTVARGEVVGLPGEVVPPIDPVELSQGLCELAVRRRPKDDETKAYCLDAAEKGGAAFAPWLLLAWVVGQRDEAPEAQEQVLDEVTRRLPPEGAELQWLSLAQMERRLYRLSRAEAAAAKAGPLSEAEEVTRSCAEVRLLYELRPGERAGQLSAEEEAPYARAMGRFRQSLGRQDLPAAQVELAELSRRFGKAAPHDELCRALIERRALKEARASCEAAAKLRPEAARPQLHLGLLELLSGRLGPAVKALEAANARDPAVPEAWRLLHTAERAMGTGPGIARIGGEYRARLGRSIT